MAYFLLSFAVSESLFALSLLLNMVKHYAAKFSLSLLSLECRVVSKEATELEPTRDNYREKEQLQ